MKSILLALAGLTAAYGILTGNQTPASEETVIVIGGDSHGNLAPCGCTKPMTGGIRRRVSLIRSMTLGKPHLILENGGFTAEPGRQSELKAEALAETFGDLGAVVHFHSGDAGLGKGAVASVQRLAKVVLLGGVQPDPSIPAEDSLFRQNFSIAVASPRTLLADTVGGQPISVEAVIAQLLQNAQEVNAPAILMLDGDRDQAASIAAKHPSLAMIVYSSKGDPPNTVERVGSVALVTPGEDGKFVVRVGWKEGLASYKVFKLGPEIPDDAFTSRVYERYLARVREEGLLDQIPRGDSEPYAGSKACSSCHGVTYRKWAKSGHAKAFLTLEKEGHDFDPDCVPCHVVGIRARGGFVSRIRTPQFASVGCESCHGPSKAHAKDPKKFHLPKVKQDTCITCHTAQNSPNFDFDKFWKKIIHK